MRYPNADASWFVGVNSGGKAQVCTIAERLCALIQLAFDTHSNRLSVTQRTGFS